MNPDRQFIAPAVKQEVLQAEPEGIDSSSLDNYESAGEHINNFALVCKSIAEDTLQNSSADLSAITVKQFNGALSQLRNNPFLGSPALFFMKLDPGEASGLFKEETGEIKVSKEVASIVSKVVKGFFKKVKELGPEKLLGGELTRARRSEIQRAFLNQINLSATSSVFNTIVDKSEFTKILEQTAE